MKKNYVIAIVSVILCVVVAATVYFFTPYGKKLSAKLAEKKTEKVQEPKYLNYVFAPTLIRLHEQNAEEYKSKYAGQIIQATLKFKKYDVIPQSNKAQGQYGRYVAEFSCGTEFLRQYSSDIVVKCYFDGDNASAFAKLKKNDIVTLEGTCIPESDWSWGWNLELKGCKVLEVKSSQGSDPNILMYKVAADNGNSEAMFRLGNIYSLGLGVPTDYKSAAKWYRKAAELGSSAALNNLGELYRNGQGVPKDLEKAFKLYTLAADRGGVVAMYNLGELYEFGGYVSQDYNKAREWYQKSFECGYTAAEGALKRVLGK